LRFEFFINGRFEHNRYSESRHDGAFHGIGAAINDPCASA